MNRFTSEPEREFVFSEEIHINVGVGNHKINFFKVHGVVRIMDQIAEVTEVTDLTNLTGLYADVYDGSTSDLITHNLPGAVLTAAPVGSYFIKDQDPSKEFTVKMADQGRMHETTSDRWFGKPYIASQKGGTDTFVRLVFDTTSGVDFKVHLRLSWRPMNGGYLELL